MPSTDESKILPPMMNDRGRPPRSRAVLGVLMALLCIAVLLALWSLAFNRDDDTASNSGQAAQPTPITLPTTPPAPAATPTVVATPTPEVAPTALPTGLQTCTDTNAPLTTATYVVDTNTTPLNQRIEPSIDAEQTGTFDAGQEGLVFTGECVVNADDGYTWWKIFNGSDDVWVASDFLSIS